MAAVADQRRHVQVVPAGVHDGDVPSRIVLGADLAGIREAGLFFDRKGIKFGAQHHGRPGAVFQDSDHPGPAHVFGNAVAQVPQPARQLLRGLRLMRREFRILMKINIESVGVGIDSFHFRAQR